MEVGSCSGGAGVERGDSLCPAFYQGPSAPQSQKKQPGDSLGTAELRMKQSRAQVWLASTAMDARNIRKHVGIFGGWFPSLYPHVCLFSFPLIDGVAVDSEGWCVHLPIKPLIVWTRSIWVCWPPKTSNWFFISAMATPKTGGFVSWFPFKQKRVPPKTSHPSISCVQGAHPRHPRDGVWRWTPSPPKQQKKSDELPWCIGCVCFRIGAPKNCQTIFLVPFKAPKKRVPLKKKVTRPWCGHFANHGKMKIWQCYCFGRGGLAVLCMGLVLETSGQAHAKIPNHPPPSPKMAHLFFF